MGLLVFIARSSIRRKTAGQLQHRAVDQNVEGAFQISQNNTKALFPLHSGAGSAQIA